LELAPRSRYARAMCGRVRLSSDVSGIKLVVSTPNIAPSLKALLAPYPSEEMVAWLVSPRVGQRQEQRPEPDRADRSAMSFHRRLAAVFVLLALAGCVQVATEQGRPPYDNNTEYPRDRGGDGGWWWRWHVGCGGNRDLAGPPLKILRGGHHRHGRGTRRFDEHGKGELRFIYHNSRVFSVALLLAVSARSPHCPAPSSAAR
jgi:hypothetical protein